ncbi:MAG: ParB/RepB/Spo0J family partition protein [Parachlamydiaceae bacterium]|nr:ParB/RepB/Spo0J family partition protein [Parachlamydiaceae bacterium]
MPLEEELRQVAIDRIQVNPYQPRRVFSDHELQELADSIKVVGLIHPPVVRPGIKEGDYELVSGERRLRAAKKAGFSHIPVVVRVQDHQTSAQAALIENIQRVDLNAIEIAKALKALMEQLHLNQEALALRMGKKRSTVANYLRLLTLPVSIQKSVSEGTLSMGHAKALLSLEDLEQLDLLHHRIVDEELSVRATEEIVQRLLHPPVVPKRRKPLQDLHVEQIVNQMQQKLGTKVAISGKGSTGKIVIDYYNFDDLDRLLQFFSIEV